MRYTGINVVLIIITMIMFAGCKGEPDKTGVPVFLLPGNVGEPVETPVEGPMLRRIVIEPEAVNIVIGGQQIYRAIGHYDDGAVVEISGSVKWFSSNIQVGTVDDKGTFSSKGLGYAAIGASFKRADGNTIYSNYAWANVSAADEKPPEPVRNVEVELIGNHARLSWDPSPEPDIKGYNVYRTRISGQDYDKDEPLNDKLILLTHWTDVNPGGGIVYYVVAAVNEDDEVGAFSSEVTLDFNPQPPWDD